MADIKHSKNKILAEKKFGLQKIEFQPLKDQKNGTSKNDLKTGLGALNRKI